MFIPLESINTLALEKHEKLFKQSINPQLYKTFKILGLSDLVVNKASGSYLYSQQRKILDYTSSCGILALGHNNPEILKAQKFCHQELYVDALKFGISPLQSTLASNLSSLLSENLNTCYFAVSGAEANEAAIKLATRYHKSTRDLFLVMKDSFHGKTHATMPFTTSENFSHGFHHSFPQENIISTPFNNVSKLIETFESFGSRLAAVMIEPIQGQNVEVADQDFIKALYEYSRKYDTLVIFDEVKVGLGRSGKLFTYMHYDGATPDILTTSKALGGGKHAISAMVTDRKIFNSAYPSRRDATLHSTTFGGLGEACAVAIKTLEILKDETFQSEVENKSAYFFKKLERIKSDFSMIKRICGQGLYLGIEFNPRSILESSLLGERYKEATQIYFSAFIVKKMIEDYNILVFFTGSKSNIIHVLPPLTTDYDEIDYFCKSLEDLLKNLSIKSNLDFFIKTMKSFL